MSYIEDIAAIGPFARIEALKRDMLVEPRYASIEQARIITESYRETEGQPRAIQRASALAQSLCKMRIRIEPGELIVGNRTHGVRGGVVFPETGASWVDAEFESLPTRAQDRFNIRMEDVREFRERILPYWKGRSLEDHVRAAIGPEVDRIAKVVKINQKDHSQGHICPNTERWLRVGPAGLRAEAAERLAGVAGDQATFYRSVVIAMDGVIDFMNRYACLADELSVAHPELTQVARICRKLASAPAEGYHEALQSVWFLYVVLQMEGNASSYSPGRMDQYLYPYFQASISDGSMDLARALELTECLWLKFNQIVYLRNRNSARYFAGFPIGFNVAIGGQTAEGGDASNELSYLFLQAQRHLLLPQPNLSLRVFEGSPEPLLREATRVIALGSGMPQLFNDEVIVPALRAQGIDARDAVNYAIVGCVELTTHGNSLGWSDAAMFNLVKALELTLNHGVDLLTGERVGLDLGDLTDYRTYEDLEAAFAQQIDHFMDKCAELIAEVERQHARLLPTPFLSAVIDDCLIKGKDVTEGGAHYNFTGVQAIQVANVADSLAAIKALVYGGRIPASELMNALRSNFEDYEILRQMLINKAPKYGNDVVWVDETGAKWARYFAGQLKRYRNGRGGTYQMGLYTVSAHVPMGQNVGASADGRRAMDPLADGGVSAMYGRDRNGPTALLQSVARLPLDLATNGALLNMKFVPSFFKTESGIGKFVGLIRAFCRLKISHAQFNVLSEADLRAAQRDPERFRGMTVRVAGYTAYFTELAKDLQDEIIERTAYSGL